MIGNGRRLTGREKLDAYELQQTLFRAADWCCVPCGEPLASGIPQLGHRFGQGKGMLAKYGPEVIHHPLAMVPVNCLRCNSLVMIGDETEPGRALVARIRRILAGDEPEPDMAEEYRLLHEEFRESKAVDARQDSR